MKDSGDLNRSPPEGEKSGAGLRNRLWFAAGLLLGRGRQQLENVPTTVYFRPLTDAQIERYLNLEQPYDCAGSAKIESLGVALVHKIDSDDPTALIGLPLMTLITMLQREHVKVI